MSKEYNEYIATHVAAVNKCYEMLTGKRLAHHDVSKYTGSEYEAYDKYFYPPEGHTKDEYKDDFRFAWNHHQKNNPHHWQYWVLINGDGDFRALEMPARYIFEMVADWGAFALIRKNPDDIRTWYAANRANMILHPATRVEVENLVDVLAEKIREHLEEQHDEE